MIDLLVHETPTSEKQEIPMSISFGAVAVSLLTISGTCNPITAGEGPAHMTRAAAAEALKQGLETARQESVPEKQIDLLRHSAEEVLQGRPENILVAEALSGAMQAPAPEASKTVERLRSAIADAVEILKFEIQEESPLPDGFPKPAPVGEIVVQHFPVYRSAKVDVNAGDNGAFMRLFGHIQSKGISMTTPVEMNYAPSGDGRSQKVAMSFLYRSTQQGTVGGDTVKVQDVGELTAVSIGLRGYASEERVEEAKRHLEGWLASHTKEYRASGPIRTLIYNSPFIPEKKQFFEVQIPIGSIPSSS